MKYDELYVSVDVETTGSNHLVHSMYEIGACLVERPDTEWFFREIALRSDAHEPKSLTSCGRTLEELKARTCLGPKRIMLEFAVWLSAVAGQYGRNVKPVFVGFATPFDWKWVDTYFLQYYGENPFGFCAPDIKPYYMGLTRGKWGDARSSRIHPRFKPNRPHTHNALDDAREQAEMFARMLDFADELGPLEIPDVE